MIITIIGGIGSGKSLSCIKIIKESKNYPLTNFNLKNMKYHRLMLSDILKTLENEKKISYEVNWDFWNKQRKKDFSIYLDEAHNIVHARTSMSLRNRIMNKWISQIRKILSDSPTNHLYIITQLPRMIDVTFRELTQVVIHCSKLEYKNKVYIIQKFYNGFRDYELNICSAKTYFLGNPYFKYYNTKELVKFDDADKFI